MWPSAVVQVGDLVSIWISIHSIMVVVANTWYNATHSTTVQEGFGTGFEEQLQAVFSN